MLKVDSELDPVAPVSQAHAGAYFAEKVLDGLNGVKGIKECTFVESPLTSAPFFASPVRTKTWRSCAGASLDGVLAEGWFLVVCLQDTRNGFFRSYYGALDIFTCSITYVRH